MTLSIVSYGGGVNSTALLVGLHERGERPDAILFADTGGERPEVYEYVRIVSAWCERVGFPAIVTVRYAGKYETLEEECLGSETLPSLAYGFGRCSEKWKIRPIGKWILAWPPAVAALAGGEPVVQLLGIDADEAHRGTRPTNAQLKIDRPLIRWGWGRSECVAAIERAGLPPATKSACFFCPATRKPEVLALAADRPDLYARAITIERNAAPNLGIVRGLGRHWSWEALVAADAAQGRLFPETVEEHCGCYDGDPTPASPPTADSPNTPTRTD